MLASFASVVLASVSLSVALPVANPALVAPLALRTVTSLDQAAVAESQQRDNTATRAFTAQEIRTSDGKCFDVNPLAGDFRENLIPIQINNCNGSDSQKWDVITKGIHNNVAGEALIVSSLTNGCLNFDDRRAAGNQVLLFSCGGRADGSGQVQNAQLYAFNGSAVLTLQPLSNPGTCLFPNGALLDQEACNGASDQVFTIGGTGSGSSATSTSATSTASTTSTTSSTVTTSTEANDAVCSGSVSVSTSFVTVFATQSTTTKVSSAAAATTTSTTTAATTTTGNEDIASSFNPSATVSVSRGGTLNPSAAAQANQRDDTATRAFSSIALQDSAGQCLTIDPTAGDFREELIPIQTAKCDGSENQQWDIITSGKHDNVPNAVLIVNTLVQGCMNFDPRRATGDTVILFACGGRGDGTGQTTNSQLFPLPVGKTIVLAPQNGNNQTCLAPNSSGRLDSTNCDNKADQVFSIVTSGSGSNAQTTAAATTSVAATTSTAAATTTAAASSATTTAPPTKTTVNNENTSSSATVSVSRAGGVLNPSAAAEANPRDDTATRAFSGIALKDSAGKCLSVDPTAGDFRENLIPIEAVDCDGSENQQWDIITSGKHDNVPNSVLVVSTSVQGCMNFDPRRAAGDTVILFSCGGRADGGGQTTNSQLFPLPVGKTIVLAPQNGNNQTCLIPNSSGRLDQASCDGKADQIFTIA